MYLNQKDVDLKNSLLFKRINGNIFNLSQLH